MPEADSHVLRWEYGEGDHPVIAELRSRPGHWAILWEVGSSIKKDDDYIAMSRACLHHPHVQTEFITRYEDVIGEIIVGWRARWTLEIQ